LSRIGKVTAHVGLQVFNGEAHIDLSQKGYAHFG
jgi:thiamine-monophosphate kinase